LGVEPTDEFPAYMDLHAFAGEPKPLPAEPQALFVGVLERYKGIDVLLRAWDRVGVGKLRVVGTGSLSELVAQSQNVVWEPRLAPEQVASAVDGSWCLVLPSRSEGMGRVLVESFCRGRAVVGTRAGSIPDLVCDGENGLLVPADDELALAAALTRVLGDRALADRLGAGARASAEPWLQTPQQWAARTRALVEKVLR
jgi:glycosyltransferase involved in cell wall biosynthesis